MLVLQSKKKICVCGEGFRENMVFGFILRVVVGSKMAKDVGYPNKDGLLLCADPRGLFLNALLRCRCSVKVKPVCSTVSLVLSSRL